ncbi:MAG TPA: RNA polymerase sigma factor [Thermoanaerobaculia bacterium]|nr:RNA polymerase sigma factor [Thermoanaerobaculia bacterium]
MPFDDDPSRRLVELIQNGIEVEDNRESLFKRHFRRVGSFFLRHGFTPEEARDLTQDVFLRAFRGIGSFRLEARFATWLLEIADHVYQNELRRRGTARRKGQEIPIQIGGQSEEGENGDEGENREALAFEPPPISPRAFDDMLGRERAERLNKAIHELPYQMRTCFLLRYQQGRRYDEIAVMMRVSVDTVKAHLHQAKKRLKLELTEDLQDNR